MAATKSEILEMVRALPVQERIELFEELGAAYEAPVPQGMSRDEFSAELETRWQQHQADPSKTRPAGDVLADLRRKHLGHD